MIIDRKYIKQDLPVDEYIQFCSDLTGTCRKFKELFPHSMGWEIKIADMMIEIDSDPPNPFQVGMMFSEDSSQDHIHAQSLAYDLQNHIRRHIGRGK